MNAPKIFTTDQLRVLDSVREINNLFHERGWTDGLPIIPPTEDALGEMLRYTDYAASDVLCELPPRGAEATIELLAINCVMAGCLPKYFPVVITAVKAAMVEKYNLYGRQTTTNPAAHLVLINGPIRKELDVNCAGQCFGPGWRANATIGRAVRLIFRNIGGAIPQVTDMSTHGMPARYTYCIGELEEESPWEPLHVELGHARDVSTVTIFPGQCPVNSFEHVAKTPHRYLGTIASTMAHLGTNGIYRPGESMIVFAPEGAKFIADFGWSKLDIKQALFEYARQKVKDARDRGGWFHATEPKVWIDISNDDATMPVVKSPESIFIVVAGGPGRHNLVIPTTGDLTECVTLPITFKDGRPIRSVRDFVN
ncbi:MAG: hypothetical protein FJY56_16330 [Betaproteobacteria bacterium]|nr:hypothetical protein [Betaproteobacteria bacterium]